MDTIIHGGLAVLPTGPRVVDIGIEGDAIAAISARGSLGSQETR